MRTAIVAIVAFAIWLGPSQAQPQRLKDIPDGPMARAVGDLLTNFWRGTPSSGSITDTNLGRRLDVWQRAQVAAVLDGVRVATGSADAAMRLGADWSHIKAFGQPVAAFGLCGFGVQTPNHAQDDTAWDAGYLLQVYEASGALDALAAARSAMDCAWSRWGTTGPDHVFSGLWYDDGKTVKALYQAVAYVGALHYAMDAARSDPAGAAIALGRAVAGEAWAAAALRCPDGIVGAGLYGMELTKDGNIDGATVRDGVITACAGVAAPRQASARTMLVGNMAMAVLDARLAALARANALPAGAAPAATYTARAKATAAAILAYERDGAGVLLDDRDADDNGYMAVPFTRVVLPILDPPQRTAWKTILAATGAAVLAHARQPDGTYAGCWDGPGDASCVWTANGQSVPGKASISANALIWQVADYVASTLP